MMRSYSTYSIIPDRQLKEKLLAWAATFSVCCLLDSVDYDPPYHSYDLLIGAGAADRFIKGADFVASFSAFDAGTNDWIFGHAGYDAGRMQKVNSDHINNGSGFPGYFFFVPEIVVQLEKNSLTIGVLERKAGQVYQDILQTIPALSTKYQASIKQRQSHKEFTKNVSILKEHIHRGDCYEINYCTEFFIENIMADPTDLYRQLTAISPNPFAAFYKIDDQYALCASPERYVKKTGERLISQPIKGTAARALHDPALDERNRLALQESEKDKRENVIVVDLVRNDFSRVCMPGSVVVEELFGIYAFPTVFQMISTIAGTLIPGQDFAKVLEATFPMGSMTGAPKKKVMELIDRYEVTERGLYSGTIGYIDPQKNFDFNVVIRTVLYNRQTGYMNYLAGAGITHLSDPEKEYEECLLKTAAFSSLFDGS